MSRIIDYVSASPLQSKMVEFRGIVRKMTVQSGAGYTEDGDLVVYQSFRSLGNEEEVIGIEQTIIEDVIQAWRAAEILAALPQWSKSSLPCAVEASRHDRGNWSDRTEVEKMVAPIRESYDLIMRTVVPEYIIDEALVRIFHKGAFVGLGFHPTWILGSVHEELSLGLLPWRVDFERLGLMDPEDEDNNQIGQREMAVKYGDELKLFKKNFGFNNPASRWFIERILALLVLVNKRGLATSPDLAFGLAIILAKGSREEDISNVSHWLPGAFPQHDTIIWEYTNRLLELRYQWYGFNYHQVK